MEIYIVDGYEYDISKWPQEEKDEFMAQNPTAKLKEVSEPVKKDPVVTDATAGGLIASDGELNAEDTSLDSSLDYNEQSINSLNKNKEDAEKTFKKSQYISEREYNEAEELSSNLDDIKKKEEQLRKFFTNKRQIAVDRAGESVYNYDGFEENYESSEEERLNFPEYFNEDGTLKTEDEIKILETDLEAREVSLIENPLYNTLQKIDQKYDSAVIAKLTQEEGALVAGALVTNEDLNTLNDQSLGLFGRPLDSLADYEFKSQEEVDEANKLIKEAGANYKTLAAYRKDAESLGTFYNNIENKNAQVEYAKDWKGVSNEIKLGWSNGKLNTTLLSYEIGRPFDMNSVEDMQEVISTVVRETKFQKGLLNSEEFAAFNAAGNADEFMSTEQMSLLLSSDAGPEIMASLVGNSLSQMLATGRYIIPSSIAAGTVKGSVMGSTLGPAGSFFGALGGGLAGMNIGMALTNGAVEYGNSIFEAMRRKGYNLEDTDDVERAFNDKEVWSEGRKIGISRAIPIMLVDYLGGRFAGKLVDPLASPLTRALAITAESTVLQPGVEAIGEAAAQISAHVVAGEPIVKSEITMEALGGLGSKSPQLAGSLYYQSTNKYKTNLANKLAENLDFVVDQNQSPSRINTWAKKMLDDKKIDEDTYSKIINNATVADEANQAFDNMRGDMSLPARALNTIKNGRKNKQIKSRLSDIISERRYLEKALKEVKRQNPESSDIGKYKDALNQISKELNSIEKTGNIDTQDSFKTRNDLDALAIRQFEIGKRILGKDGTNLTLQEIEGVKSLSLKELKKKYNITTKEAKQLKSGSAAVNSNGKMLLNKDALRDGYLDAMVTGDASAYTVFSHEILHTVLSNKFSKKEITNISANLEAYVDSEVASGKGIISGRVKKRIDQRMSKYRNNDQYTKAMVAEEYLTVLSDEMASGAIKFEDQNKGFWNSIKEQIKDALFGIGMTEKEISDFQIETGEDAFNFLKTYSQTFKKDGIGVQVKNQKTNSGSTKSSTQLKQDDYDAIDALAADPDFDPDSTFDNKRLIKAAGGIIEATTKRLYDRTDAMNKIDVDRDKFKKDLASLFTLIFKNYDESADVNNNGIGKQTSNLYNLRANALATETFKQTATGVRIDENFDVAESLDESKINDNAKVRQAKPFSNLKNITEDVIVVLSSKIKSVLSDISIRTATPRTVIDQIKNLVKTDLFKDIKKGMGSISKPGGVVTVSPEYKAYHDNNYKEIVEAIPLSSAKKKYKTLFKIEKIKREKDRKVNKETGKVTYPGTGVFKVQVPKKGEFGSYHTVQKPGMGINTLIERQTSLAKEIATGLTSEIVSTYIEENVTTLTKDMKLNQAIAIDNVFDQIKDSLDPNSNEQRKFDIVKATTQLTLETDLSKGLSIIDDLRQTVKSGISPEAAAVLMSSKYGIDEERFDGTIKILNIALSKFDLKDINPEVYKQIAEQEGINVDQQLEYDGNWETFLERTNLKKYSSYDYNEKDPKLRAKNKAKFEKSLTSYLLKLPDAVLNNQMFLQAFQNSTATGSFYANIDEIKNVVNNVKKARGKFENNSGIDWSKVNYSPEVARKLALLSNENLKKPMSNQDLVKAYNKILAAHSIDIKETKKALKYILKSVDTFFNENNKSVEAGKFITTWMRMQTNFSKGIFRGAAQFESMSLTPSKTTFKTGSPALRAQVAEELGITSDEAKYLNNPSSQLSKASKAAGVTKKGIKAGLEARYTDKQLKKLEADVKKGLEVPKEFHGEHDIALMLFTTNVFKTMNDGNFDTKYDDIAKYYSQTLLNENDRMLVDSKWGKTGNSPDYYFGMMPEIRFTEVIPGIAKDIFMFEYGTTLDQVILNKLASKEVLNNKDLTKKLVTALKESISTKSLQVVRDNKTTIISDPSIRETYNELISETATEIYNETDNSNSQATAVELTTQIENKQEVKETQKQNAEILETTNEVKASTQLSTNEIIENFKELDAQVENNRQEVMASSQLNLSDELNNVIQDSKGVNASYVYSKAKARALGSKVGKWKFFIPPSAEDFKGLLYSLLSKGKVGDAQLQMLKENLFRPFARGIGNINSLKQTIVNDYTALKKQYPKIKKLLSKEIPTGGFTYDTAARVYMWTKSGVEIPGLSKADQKELVNEVKNNPELKAFINKLSLIPKITTEWVAPDADWQIGNIASDINDLTNKISRKKFLAEWIANKNEMFSEANLNKLEALYGSNYREALEDVLYRMEYGTNRSQGAGRLVNGFMDWINNSVGAIMFFNTRTALLQQLSITNFINWSDNNIVSAAAAFANQNQFWSDFSKLWNSDYLKQRRSGLQSDINEAEIASAVANSKNKAKALISYLLKKGFLPTQLADSFAIATGGASMYRNRIKTYIKQGMSKADAESKAFTDFQEIAEETQQSSRPDLISQQQAGPLGRVILAFQNTPMQYMRLSKKALLDLINRRGDDKTNISKIIYYTAIQNLIFTSLQNALFASLLGDEDDEKIDNKKIRMMNSSADTILKGMGIGGAAVATIKNILIKFASEENKPRPNHAYTVLEAINFSPPVGSKLRKFYSALQSYTFDKDKMYEEGLSLDNPAYVASGKVISAFTNIPLDRVFIKIENLRASGDSNLENWQRVARFLGYSKWDINPPAKESSTKSKYSRGGLTTSKSSSIRRSKKRTTKRRK